MKNVNIYGLLRLCPILLFFLLGGCMTAATPIAYAPAVPPEKTCTINIVRNITVTKFDEQVVSWKAGLGDYWAQVQIPEGKHTFVFDYQHTGGIGTLSNYEAGGLLVTYDHFVAGHTYLMTAQPFSTDTRSLTIRVGVKDVTNEPDWGSLSNAFSWTDGFEWLPITRK